MQFPHILSVPQPPPQQEQRGERSLDLDILVANIERWEPRCEADAACEAKRRNQMAAGLIGCPLKLSNLHPCLREQAIIYISKKKCFFSSYLLESSDFQSISHDEHVCVLVLGHPVVSQNMTPFLPLGWNFPYSENILGTCSGSACTRTPVHILAHPSRAWQGSGEARTGHCRAEVAGVLRTPTNTTSALPPQWCQSLRDHI